MADKLIGVGNKIEINIIKDRNVRKDEEKVRMSARFLIGMGNRLLQLFLYMKDTWLHWK